MDESPGLPVNQPDGDGIEKWLGMDIHDPSGNKIGEVEDVYYQEETQQPEWLSIGVGWLGRVRLIPAAQVEMTARGLKVQYSKDEVKGSPAIKEPVISHGEERELYAYYGLEYDKQASDACEPAAETKPGLETAEIQSVDVSRARLREQRLAEERRAETTRGAGVGPEGRPARRRNYRRPSECARVSQAAQREGDGPQPAQRAG